MTESIKKEEVEELFGLFGFPLSHSFSKGYFADKFAKENIQNALYTNFEIESIDLFNEVVNSHPNLKGTNVTIPYKEQVIPFLDELDESAAAIGAVNTIKYVRDENGKLIKKIGYNTDSFGFKQAIKPFFKSQHERALILGTGGASKAVKYVLNQLGVECIFVSRSGEGKDQISYDQLSPIVLKNYKMIVNTTPLGMSPNVNECPPLPYDAMDESFLLYDLIYNPEETLFMKKGREHGAVALNGLTMLHQQAEGAWRIWNDL